MIAFDLDGTLVDSAAEIGAAMEHAWRAVVPALPYPRERFYVGPPLPAMIARLAPELDLATRAAIVAAFRAQYDASDFSATRPFPGIPELLANLVAAGETLALATNKRRAPTLAIVQRWLPDRFAKIACVDAVSPDDGTAPGTKVDMLRWLGPEVRVLVGDTAGDMAAARQAGARAIGVTWGQDDEATLAAAGATRIAHTVAALAGALRTSA
ncbi:MAG: haloacid dehalogenase [Labilithrix sp.]|nr:haloacid dehalogenase [Labilithrix sp.]